MKKFIKEFKFTLIFLCIINIAFITLMVVPTKYDITIPATVDPIKNTYDFEGIDESNISFNSVSVMSYYKVSVLNYMLAKLNPFAIIEETDENVKTDLSYQISSGTIQKNNSLTLSLIAGFDAANLAISKEFKGYIIHSLYGKHQSAFKIGDVITEVEGITMTEEENPSSVLLKLCGTIQKGENLYLNLDLNKSYQFVVRRSTELITLDVKPFTYLYNDLEIVTLGVSFYPHFSVSDPEINYKINDPLTYGPSAGLMQSLFIYDALTSSNLSKGIKVCGTGTIDQYGNVGAIGGIKAKIFAAHLANVDVFFVPYQNKDDALEAFNSLKTDMEVYVVTSLDDCINYLKNRGKN